MRDPLERLLSGYIDKCVKFKFHWCEIGHEWTAKDLKNIDYNDINFTIPNFDEFATVIANKIKNGEYINVHYRPQSYWCDLYKYIEYFNIKIYYHHETMSLQFQNVLKQLNLNQFYYNWGKYQNETLFMEQTIHVTNADHLLKQYYTPQLANLLYNAYLMDYILLNFSYPKWIHDQW